MIPFIFLPRRSFAKAGVHSVQVSSLCLCASVAKRILGNYSLLKTSRVGEKKRREKGRNCKTNPKFSLQVTVVKIEATKKYSILKLASLIDYPWRALSRLAILPFGALCLCDSVAKKILGNYNLLKTPSPRGTSKVSLSRLKPR
jgi:hypothetical protein